MPLKRLRVLNRLSHGFILVLVSGASTLAWAQLVPESAEITQVELSGSGCDQMQTSVSLSPDFKDISILFDNYIAEIGDGSQNPTRLELNKDCQIQLNLRVPSGWQMAFRAADYRGAVMLSSQGWAFHRFSILQEGAPIVSMKEAMIRGPYMDEYHVRSEVRPERLTWSPCIAGETKVKLLSQLGVRLNPRSSDRSFSQVTLDSADGSLKQNLTVEWRQCRSSTIGQTEYGREVRDPRDPVRPIRPPRYRGSR